MNTQWAGEPVTDITVVEQAAHGGRGVMVWAGVCHVSHILLGAEGRGTLMGS